MLKIFTYICLIIVQLSAPVFADTNFPIQGNVKDRVSFWKKVYTEINTNEAFLHDSKDLAIIYKKVSMPSNRHQRRRFLKSERRKIRTQLANMAKKKLLNLSADELELKIKLESSGVNLTTRKLNQLARSLRFQYGLKDRYLKGLIRSYEFRSEIKKIFDRYNLPEELTFLPHVESSFNYHAYSKVGAAGIWQFMRSTGRNYRLKINYAVDERRDVLKATNAAARLLRDNYKILKTWPLALTAYNHGASSLKRAIRRYGTRDIHTIIDKYRGRRFGFASKNFYATFMATVEISKNPEKYFPNFTKANPLKYETLSLSKPLTIYQLRKITGLNKSKLRRYNPSIRASAFRSPIRLPVGHDIYLPKGKTKSLKSIQLAIKELTVKDPQDGPSFEHIVSKGESLYDLSRLYKVSLNKIINYNQISNPSRVYPGMKIIVPGKDAPIKEPKIVAQIKENIGEKPTKGPEIKKVEPEASKVTSIAKTEVTKATQKTNPLVYGPALSAQKLSLVGYNLELKKTSPSGYRIQIETEETLGHLADWAGLRTQKIRDWNKLRFGGAIHVGQKLTLYLNDENKLKFEQERNEYHLSIQEDFFENYTIDSMKDHIVSSGQTLSEILKEYNLPFWLVRKEQADSSLSANLKVGQVIKIPSLIKVSEESGLIPEDKEDSDASF